MKRRRFLGAAGSTSLLSLLGARATPSAAAAAPLQRVRPTDPGWPAPALWDDLKRQVGGQLIKVPPLLEACAGAPTSAACDDVLRNLRNPYFLGEQPAGTQTSGWVDGWRSSPSAYAVAAKKTADVAAAVNFARTHNLRVVVKGGGHSYQGTSNAPDSLLIWTRPMDAITLHDMFTPAGCAGKVNPTPAVSVQTGARWLPVYNAVTTKAGRYVQGGGCATVGVAGLVTGGGFGSFSKHYGMAAAGLLEAEVVTADGAVRIANACTHPDLFWALKGAGGGSFGVVTRLTLRTREIPEFFGGVLGTIQATSDAAFRRLIARFTSFYAEALFNPRWGESVYFRPDNTLVLGMVFHGLTQAEAAAVWKPFLDWVAAAKQDYAMASPPRIIAVPARHWWDPVYLRQNLPETIIADARPSAPEDHVYWAGNQDEAGFFLHGYESAWLPATLLEKGQQARFSDAVFAGSRLWKVSLHFNKGLAGAPPEAVKEARDTAMNSAVTSAFALAIIAGGGPPAYPGMPGPGPDLAQARRDAAAIAQCIGVLRKLVPGAGSYVSEAGFFDPDWRRGYWGRNYARLLAVKKQYDPYGLFIVHHGVGSEFWSADGFTRIA
jgi:FAD/FMN-containing dehydrogenase